MTVQELLKKINNKTFNLEKSLEIKKYIPIMNKKKFVMDVIATYTDDIDGLITVDRFNMYIYFDMKVLSLYTNLEISDDFNEMIMQYDMLCESGMRDKIIILFENDYDILCALLEDELETLLIQNSIDTQVVKIANKINDIIDVISEKLSDVDFNAILPEGTDMNKLIEMIDILR